jgi:hypothetical protein
MISSNTDAAESIRLTCSDGSSAAIAIVLANKVAASTVNVPNLNLIENTSCANPRDFLNNRPNSDPSPKYLIGELQVANRHQCRSLPQAARNDKEAMVDPTGKRELVLSASGCTNKDEAL